MFFFSFLLVTVTHVDASAHHCPSLLSQQRMKEIDAQHLAKISTVKAEISGQDKGEFINIVTHPITRAIILFLGISGLAIEIFVPGLFVPGIVGILGFIFYFSTAYATGMTSTFTLILCLVGVTLLLMELYFPSFGLFGVVGIGSFIAGIPLATKGTANVLLYLGVPLIAAAFLVMFVGITTNNKGLWKGLVLKEELTSQQGFSSHIDRTDLIGKQGKSITPLRPAGTIVIDEQMIDVVVDGSRFVPVNTVVIVVKTEGSKVVVQNVLPL